jgi:osmotically-inducible protein OsmY
MEYHDERGFWDRAGDEVRSWFGDEEASRRRARDERGWGGSQRDRWGARTEGVRDDWDYRDTGGYREPERWSPPQRYVGPSWTREPGYGGEDWERHVERPGWGDPSAWGPERVAGPHAGRGPRGYTRPDERIREDVCDRLAQHGYVDASDIDVRVSDGEVTLEGSVRERQEKRLAEDVAERVAGVRDVHNLLRVNREGPRREGGEQPGRPFRAA